MTAPTPQPPIPKLLRLNGDESESPRAWPGGGVNFEPEKPRDAVSLEPRLMQQLRESETLLAISHRLASSTDIPTVLQQIVDAAAALLGKADRAVLHILEERGDYLNAVTVAGPDRQLIQHPMNFRPGQGIAGLVLLHGKSITVADVRQDPRFVIDNSRAPRIRSLSVAPVILGEKKLGTLSVHSQQTGAFNQHDEHLLTILGSQAALALSKAQMMEAMQQRLNEVNVLYQITEKLLEARQVETALQPIASLLQETFGYYHVGIYLADEERGDLILQAASGEGSRQLEGGRATGEAGGRDRGRGCSEGGGFRLQRGGGGGGLYT